MNTSIFWLRLVFNDGSASMRGPFPSLEEAEKELHYRKGQDSQRHYDPPNYQMLAVAACVLANKGQP